MLLFDDANVAVELQACCCWSADVAVGAPQTLLLERIQMLLFDDGNVTVGTHTYVALGAPTLLLEIPTAAVESHAC